MFEKSLNEIIGNFDKDLKEEFWTLFEPKTLLKGDFFIKKGQKVLTIGYVESGVTRSFTLNKKEQEITFGFGTEGNFVAGGFSPTTRSNYSIEAITDVKIHVGSYTKLMQLFDSKPNLKAIVSELADYYIKIKQDKLLGNVFTSASDRYAEFLEEYPNLINRIPHFYVANYLGISPTQLSRLRKNFYHH